MKKIILGCLILTTGVNQGADTSIRPDTNLNELELELKVGFSTTPGRQESIRETLVAESNFGDNPGAALFGIYEGYRNDRGARILASGDATTGLEPLHKQIKKAKNIPEGVSHESVSLQNAYRTMDANLKFLFGGDAVATALTAFININKGKARIPALHFAWAGSSRALLINSNGTVAYATNAHTFENENEMKRMAILSDDEARHGIDKLPESPSGKAVTRALGVPIARTAQGVSISTIPDPEIADIELKPKHKALVLASDGLWDKIDKETAAQYVIETLKPADASPQSNNNNLVKQAAQGLVKLAYQHGSIDNISVIVVEFVWKKPAQSSITIQTEDTPRLAKALNTLLQQMPEASQKKFGHLFKSISELLAQKSPDYAAIKDIIRPHYLANQMQPGGFQLLMAFEIFDNLSRGENAAAEQLIKQNKLLPE